MTETSSRTSPPVFLQLHSLRREAAADPEGTVCQVRGLGFDGVETVSDYGWTGDQWRALLDETGLSVVAAHVSLEALENDLAGRVAFCQALGTRRMIVTALPRAPQSTARYHEGAVRLNAAGHRLNQEGFVLAYHNHDFEFLWTNPSDGRCGFQILLDETNPAFVGFEFDTFWLENTGRNAADFIREHAARTRLIHAKDLRHRDRQDVPAGQGNVDFPALLPLCAQHGWPVVLEYEGPDAVESVRQGAKYLRLLASTR